MIRSQSFKNVSLRAQKGDKGVTRFPTDFKSKILLPKLQRPG
jgi:hypothetical protein